MSDTNTTKIIVVVHGVGDQIGYASAQSVAYQFCRYCEEPAAIPLGRFHQFADDGKRSVPTPIFIRPPPSGPTLPGLAFAEVYWADIPRTVVKEGYVLEEAKRWARTIVGRYCLRSKPEYAVSSEEVTRLETVLDEMIETIFVLERVAWLGDRAGIFKFNLRKLLEDYLGDVQLVADFETYRGKILGQFDEVMRKALALSKSDQAELYLVAHSEGSVIAFLGILTAWRKFKRQPIEYKWVRSIRGLMTIGSPIETHHLLWPDLWQALRPSVPPPPENERIRWWNYLDRGDPIAYRLRKTRAWLDETREKEGVQGVQPWSHYFDFRTIKDPQETEFSRYSFPGKAHIDYWDDPELFGHFIQNVVRVPPPDRKPSDESAPKDFSHPPEDRRRAKVAYIVPYLLVAGLLFAAVFALYKPVITALKLEIEPGAFDVLRDVGGLAWLLFGMTAAVRIPRLIGDREWRTIWRWSSWRILVAAMVAYFFVVRPSTRKNLGAIFEAIFEAIFGGYSPTWGLLIATLGLLVAVVVIAFVCSWLAGKHPKWGVRILPSAGLILAAFLVGWLLHRDVKADLDVWPVLLGGAAFFYLWWLAALLFDLTFVWHHYVRSEAVADHLREHMKKAEEVDDPTAAAHG